MKHHLDAMLPTPSPVRWRTWALLAVLMLVIASSQPCPEWAVFSADAVRTSADLLHGFAPPELAPNSS